MAGLPKSCPQPVLTSDAGGVIWFHPSAIKAATMALPDCLHCGQPGRRLDHTSAIAWTDFYRCDGCGQVWSSDGPAKRRTAKIVIAPKRPGRRSGKYSSTSPASVDLYPWPSSDRIARVDDDRR